MYVFFCRCCILKCKYILRGKAQADWSLVNWVVVPSSRLNYLRASLQYTPFQSDDTKQVEREATEAEAGDRSALSFHGSTADTKVCPFAPWKPAQHIYQLHNYTWHRAATGHRAAQQYVLSTFRSLPYHPQSNPRSCPPSRGLGRRSTPLLTRPQCHWTCLTISA